MLDAKVQEANALVKEGEKLETTSIFAMRLKPDWDGASSCYERAANLYRTAKAFDLAVAANKKLAKAHIELKNYFHAAKALETASTIYKDQLKRVDLAAQLLQEAVDFYRLNGSNDTAVQVMEKAAKMMEETSPEKSIEAYLQAAEINVNEGKKRQCFDSYKRAISLLLRTNKNLRAIKVMLEHAEILKEVGQFEFAHKYFLAIIVAYLKEEDFAAAERCSKDFLSVPGFAMSDEGKAAFDAIEAYDKGDQAALDAIVKRQVFSFLDNEAAKMAKSLRVPGAASAAPAGNAVSKSTSALGTAAGSSRDQLFARPAASPAKPAPESTATASASTTSASTASDDDDSHAALFRPSTTYPAALATSTPAPSSQSPPAAPAAQVEDDDEDSLR